MNINLRIVGLYFRKTVNIANPGPVVTIKDVIEASIKQSGGAANQNGLDYYYETVAQPFPNYDDNATPSPPESVMGFVYNVPVPGPDTLTGIKRAPGMYGMFENFQADINVGLAWQSYVLDSAGVKRTGTRPQDSPSGPNGRDFRYFNQIAVFDGDTIIWRLVAICQGPNFPPATVLPAKSLSMPPKSPSSAAPGPVAAQTADDAPVTESLSSAAPDPDAAQAAGDDQATA